MSSYNYYNSGFGTSQQYMSSYPAPAVQTGGLATYGGAYNVNAPQYLTGRSYSTSSDNDFQYNTINDSYRGMEAYGGYYTTPYQQQLSQTQKMRTSLPSQSSKSFTLSQSQMQPIRNEDADQLTPQIDAAYEAVTGHKRQSVIKRQVITVPGEPARVQQVVRRLPTPTPDVIERVFIIKPQRDIVNLVIERPKTPPAQFKDTTIVGKPRRPLINPRIVRVHSRHQQQIGSSQPQMLNYSSQQYSQQFQPTMNMYQGQTSQMFSQPSMIQIYSPSKSQVEQPKGYLVAPVKYDTEEFPTKSGDNNMQLAPSTGWYGMGYGYGYETRTGAETGYNTAPSYYAYTAGYPSAYGARVY